MVVLVFRADETRMTVLVVVPWAFKNYGPKIRKAGRFERSESKQSVFPVGELKSKAKVLKKPPTLAATHPAHLGKQCCPGVVDHCINR